MSADERTEFKAQLDRIERCLVGDSAMGQIGLVARMNNHGSRINKLELWVFRIGASAAGGGAVIGLLYKIAVDWWPHR